MLATETRAILTQLHIAQQTGDGTITNARAQAALQSGNLGGFIYETWGKSGELYDSFKTINKQEAKEFVNKYIEENFGKDVYSRWTGKVRAFDINAGLDKQIGHITGDQELAVAMNEVKPGLRPTETALSRFLSDTRGGSALIRGGQTLGALGLLVAANDVHGAFEKSTGSGVGRLGRVGCDWAGFEFGTAGGALLGRGLALAFAERRLPIVAVPMLVMGGGMIGSHVFDSKWGAKVEKVLGDTVDAGIKRVRQLFS